MLGWGWWKECVWVEAEDDFVLGWEDFLVDEGDDIAEFVAYAVPILGGLVVYWA